MNAILKRTFLTLLLIIGFTLTNCNDDEYGCSCDDVIPFFNTTGIASASHYAVGQGNLANNEVIAYNNYAGIRVFYDLELVSSVAPANTSTGQLYACSCIPDGGNGSKDEVITSLEIITEYDFDEQHPAGSDISELMEISAAGPFYAIDDYLNRQELIPAENFILLPVTPPTASNNFKVNLKLTINDTKTYEKSTETVVFEE